jgi:hypothetical protein
MPDPVANFGVSSIIQFRMWIKYVDSVNYKQLNVFNYRVASGGGAWSNDNAGLIFGEFKTIVLDVWMGQSSEVLEAYRVDMQLFHWENAPSVVWPMIAPSAFAVVEGSLVAGVGEELSQSGSAVLNRQSWRTGRISMGRNYFGPLLDRFKEGDELAVDPTGTGDLNEIQSACFTNLEPTIESVAQEIKPCVMGFHIDANGQHNIKRSPIPLDDVRLMSFGPLITHLHSRRQGVGI